MQAAPTPAAYRPGGDLGGFVSKWIKIWAALLAVVTIVVVIYLIAITQTLASINGNLATAQNAVVDVGGETKTLPRQVDSVNGSLAGIDEDVRPVQVNTQKIRGSLASIQGKLANVDRSLVDSSGVLRSVLGGASDARGTLQSAQALNSEGTNLIWRQIAEANNVLITAEGDARRAVGQLERTNDSLRRICNNPAVAALPPACSR
ncbi:MAG: hypothetical protein M3404_06575 [Actinomycetota bacterium]|nr:hypothetical protein [Actinomycetota bacterium]